MGAWGRAYYRNTQGGSGGAKPREERLLKTPEEFRAIDRAVAKRRRKAETKRVNRARTRHTIPEKLVKL